MDKLTQIFDRQKELMDKYHEIEAPFRLTQDCPVNMDDPKGQLLLKDFAWRITEELAESYEALYYKTKEEAWEELGDTLHFLVEMALLSGITPTDIFMVIVGETNDEYVHLIGSGDFLDKVFASCRLRLNELTPITDLYFNFVRALGMTCHTLKNKPWKQKLIHTDVALYRLRYYKAFGMFINICQRIGMTSEDLYNAYFKKAKVNQERQENKY